MSLERIYVTFNYPIAVLGSKTLLTGIRRDSKNHNILYITGFYQNPEALITTFVYKGTLAGVSISNINNWHVLNYPSSVDKTVVNTSLYGPSIFCDTDEIRAVGNYITVQTGSHPLGCLYQGLLTGQGKWTTIIPTSSDEVLGTICHSTKGNLLVGNYNTLIFQGKAFLYNIRDKIYQDIVYPNSRSNTAYGVWKNSKHQYTICGGYSSTDDMSGLDTAYLVDYDSRSRKFTNWASFTYNNDRRFITHFEGISSDECDGYTLVANATVRGEIIASTTHVKRNKHGKFIKNPRWEQIMVPNQDGTSANSIAGTTVIGVSASDSIDITNGFVSIII